ncbi:MAG: hypothetical protein R3F07_10855 [Opitutaceae bacterium]
MKKLISLAAVLLSTSAFAVTFTDVQSIGTKLSTGQSVSGVFDIVNPGTDSFGGYSDLGGYAPLTPITDAAATFWLSDDGDGLGELARIDLGIIPLDWVGWLNNGSTTTIQVGADALDFLVFLGTAGTLNWSVKSTLGDFYVRGAMLQANTVPDGGITLILLGLGLSGLAFGRRFMKA